MQAYLEAEPATRTTKDEYVMRYQHFAKSGLEQALKKYTALHDNIGTPASFIPFLLCRHAMQCACAFTTPHHETEPILTVMVNRHAVQCTSDLLSVRAGPLPSRVPTVSAACHIQW